MNFLQKNWKGILVCLVMAVPCWLLGQKFPIVGGPVFGILAGMKPIEERYRARRQRHDLSIVAAHGALTPDTLRAEVARLRGEWR